jgi:putative zinc finger protein
MSDCTNLEMRDLLPDLARGALTGPSLVAVEQHVASCASCRAELALVRSAQVVLGATPSVDASRIVAAVVRSGAIRRNATTAVAQSRRRRAWSMSTSSRQVWLAAASVVAVAAAAALATSVARKPGSPDLAPVAVQVEEPTAPRTIMRDPAESGRSPTRPPARAELVMGGGVSDLADADLESLLRALDGLDAQIDVEPAPLLPVLEGDV